MSLEVKELENGPFGISVSPDGQRIFVTNFLSDSLSIIHVDSNEIIEEPSFSNKPRKSPSDGPSSIATFGNCENLKIYVVNFMSHCVSVFDTQCQRKTKIHVGHEPIGLAFCHRYSRAYVTNSASDTLSIIDATRDRVFSSLSVQKSPNGVAVSPDGKWIYVTNSGSDTVSVLDASTLTIVTHVSVEAEPIGIAVSLDGCLVYVANSGSDTISVLRTSDYEIVNVKDVGLEPIALVLSLDGKSLYVANSSSDSISVFDTTSQLVTANIPVDCEPSAIAVNSMHPELYVANSGCDTVSVICTNTHRLLKTIRLNNRQLTKPSVAMGQASARL